jgi:hypothetical protein
MSNRELGSILVEEDENVGEQNMKIVETKLKIVE